MPLRRCMLPVVVKTSLSLIGLLLILPGRPCVGQMPAPPVEHCRRVKIVRATPMTNPFNPKTPACHLEYAKLDMDREPGHFWSKPLQGWMPSRCPDAGELFFADIMLWDQRRNDAPLPSRITRLDGNDCYELPEDTPETDTGTVTTNTK